MAHAEVKHDYHLVDPSPWPILGSIGAFAMLVGAVFWMNKDYSQFWGLPVNGQPWIFIGGLLLVLYTMAGWWRDVIRESVVRHDHTPVVKLGLRYGMVLFIASEVMFFVAWFWAYFNSAIFPHDVGLSGWPPSGIVTLDPWHLAAAQHADPAVLGHDRHLGASRAAAGRPQGRDPGPAHHGAAGHVVHLRSRPTNTCTRPSPSASTGPRWRR